MGEETKEGREGKGEGSRFEIPPRPSFAGRRTSQLNGVQLHAERGCVSLSLRSSESKASLSLAKGANKEEREWLDVVGEEGKEGRCHRKEGEEGVWFATLETLVK